MLFIKNIFFTLVLAATLFTARAANVNYYQLKVYHYKTDKQYKTLQTYLENAYLPALHRNGIKQAGVFNTMPTDSADKRVYVLLPFNNWNDLPKLDEKLAADKQYAADAREYTDALYNDAPYNRLEVITLKTFAGMLQPAVPVIEGDKAARIYELRSYESATEKSHINKVAMFNDGDEIGIFKRLGFNAVFYGSVIAGDRMPNLMYMTVFANKDDRDKHWNTFSGDDGWKALAAKQQYNNNVSKIDVTFLQAAEYSDF